jgi:Tol biopolymer transport system component
VDVPPDARTVLRRCLQKDPSQRIRDMGDVRLALDGAFAADSQAAPAPAGAGIRRRIVEIAAVAVVAALATGGAVWLLTRPEPPSRFPMRVNIDPPDRTGPFLALSPDGRNIAFIATDASNAPRLFVHSLESAESRVLMNAGIVRFPPFWSPDGRWIAFASEGKLKRIAIAGGSAEILCDIGNLLGGTWAGNVILFSDASKGGIMQVPASGGTPVQRTKADQARGEFLHGLPWALPDGRHFLYLRIGSPNISGVYVGSIDAEPAAQDLTRLMQAQSGVAYAPSADGGGVGHLLMVRNTLLTAQPFDEKRLQLRDEPSTIAEQVGSFEIFGSFAVSAAGTVAFLRGGSETGSIVWVGRNGQPGATIAANLKAAANPRLSPDGRGLAVVVGGDVWRYDLDGRPPIKVTFNGSNFSPLWTPDGQRIVSEVGGLNPLVVVPADGSGGTEPASPKGHFHPHGWSADGKEIIAMRAAGEQPELAPSKDDVVRFAARADAEVHTVVATPAVEGRGGWLSPDRRWLAYTSDSTGRQEIWVRPFPGPGAAVRVSSNGGAEPVWSRDGRELYYLEGRTMMSVAVNVGAAFDFKPAVRLFESAFTRSEQPPSYDVGPDGRFVMIAPDTAGKSPITVILNWQERLRTSAH